MLFEFCHFVTLLIVNKLNVILNVCHIYLRHLSCLHILMFFILVGNSIPDYDSSPKTSDMNRCQKCTMCCPTVPTYSAILCTLLTPHSQLTQKDICPALLTLSACVLSLVINLELPNGWPAVRVGGTIFYCKPLL